MGDVCITDGGWKKEEPPPASNLAMGSSINGLMTKSLSTALIAAPRHAVLITSVRPSLGGTRTCSTCRMDCAWIRHNQWHSRRSTSAYRYGLSRAHFASTEATQREKRHQHTPQAEQRNGIERRPSLLIARSDCLPLDRDQNEQDHATTISPSKPHEVEIPQPIQGPRSIKSNHPPPHTNQHLGMFILTTDRTMSDL